MSVYVSFAQDTITIVEPSIVDDRGTERPDYDNPAARHAVKGCSVQPGANVETLGDRQSSVIRWTVYAPDGAPVRANSCVEFEGVRYSVDGEPQRWRSPLGRASHTMISLIDWQG